MKLKTFRNIALLATPLAFLNYYPSQAVGQPFPAQQNQKTPKETAKVLQNLTQYEIDASFLISQSIANVENQALKDKLFTLKDECEKAITALSVLVKNYGGKVPDYNKDFKGYFMEGYAAMRGAFTDQGALEALHTNLTLILKAFKSALDSSLPADAQEVVKKIYDSKVKALETVKKP